MFYFCFFLLALTIIAFMSRQIFLAFLLRVINYIFGVYLILVPEALPDNEKEGWYIISWGLLSRDW
jgi:hypothetical protein